MKKLLPVMLSAGVLLAGCGQKDTILTTDSGDVTKQDILNVIGKDLVSQIAFQKALVDTLSDEYGKELKYSDFEKEYDRQIEGMGGEEVVKKQLAERSITPEQFKLAQAVDAYQKFLVRDSVKVSDKDLSDNVRKATHILITFDPTGKSEDLTKAEAKKKAEKLLADIKKNPDNIYNVARKESKDAATAADDGKVGFIVKGQTDKEFEKTLFALNPGEISDSITESQFGYHIIKSEKIDMKKEKEAMADAYRKQKTSADPAILSRAYVKLLNDHNIKYQDDEVKQFINKQLADAQKKK